MNWQSEPSLTCLVCRVASCRRIRRNGEDISYFLQLERSDLSFNFGDFTDNGLGDRLASITRFLLTFSSEAAKHPAHVTYIGNRLANRFVADVSKFLKYHALVDSAQNGLVLKEKSLTKHEQVITRSEMRQQVARSLLELENSSKLVQFRGVKHLSYVGRGMVELAGVLKSLVDGENRTIYIVHWA